MEVPFVLLIGLFFAAAVYLMLSKFLVRVLLGVVLLGNAVNLLLFANGRILPGSKRNDLQPVYSFDAKSIWIMKSRREGTLAGSADRLAQWTSMKTRFSSEQLRSPRRQL